MLLTLTYIESPGHDVHKGCTKHTVALKGLFINYQRISSTTCMDNSSKLIFKALLKAKRKFPKWKFWKMVKWSMMLLTFLLILIRNININKYRLPSAIIWNKYLFQEHVTHYSINLYFFFYLCAHYNMVFFNFYELNFPLSMGLNAE